MNRHAAPRTSRTTFRSRVRRAAHAVAPILALTALPSVAAAQDLPWNPYHGARPAAKPGSEPEFRRVGETAPPPAWPTWPPAPSDPLEGQEVQAARKPAPWSGGTNGGTSGGAEDGTLPWNPYHAGGSAPPKGLNSGPPIPEDWLDREEYPEGPYGTRVVRAVVTRDALRARPTRTELQLYAEVRDLDAWRQELDGRLRDAERRLASIEPMKHASQDHLEAWLDVRDLAWAIAREREACRGRLDAAVVRLEQLRRDLESVGDTTVVWHLPKPQERTFVPRSYLEQKAVEWVRDNPGEAGREVHLRF